MFTARLGPLQRGCVFRVKLPERNTQSASRFMSRSYTIHLYISEFKHPAGTYRLFSLKLFYFFFTFDESGKKYHLTAR